MAYLLVVAGLVYTLAWGAGLMFSLKSEGQKNPLIPIMGLVVFITLSAVAGQASMAAMKNPPRLTVAAFNGLQEGMPSKEVVGVLGGADANPDRVAMDLNSRGVSVPSAVAGRLTPGENIAEATSARLSLTIIGEPSRRNAREGLGAVSEDEKNGLVGLQVVLTENGNETSFIEGEHWTYENGDTAELVAAKIGEAINAHPSWGAEGSTEDAPKKVFIESVLDTNRGDLGNEMKGRVASGPNSAVRVGYREDGKWVQFRGGQYSVEVQFWTEDDIVLDGDFSMTDRLILVAYVDDKITEGGIRQAGLGLPAEI
jgi:hypothetical protein